MSVRNTAGRLDTRRVQTAVLGGVRSYDPVIMPVDTHEARYFRRLHASHSFWCGVWLGGCGRQLMMRVGEERVPHFAHHREKGGVRCRRSHLGSTSADHLYLNRDLTRWLRGQGLRVDPPVFDGVRAGGACSGVRIGLSDGSGVISAVVDPGYAAAERREWQGGPPWVNWLLGPGVGINQRGLERDGYALRFRMVDQGGERTPQIGTHRPGRGVQWSDLGDCVVDEHGISTTHVREVVRLRGAGKRPASDTGPPRDTGTPSSSGAALGFPVHTDALVVLPKNRASVRAPAPHAPGHHHVIGADCVADEDGAPIARARVRFPEPITKIAMGRPYRLVPPAFIGTENAPDPDGSAVWTVYAHGLHPLKQPDPVSVPPGHSSSMRPAPVSREPEAPTVSGAGSPFRGTVGERLARGLAAKRGPRSAEVPRPHDPRITVTPERDVPLSELRLLLTTIGQRYGLTGNSARAELCAQTARALKQNSVQIPELPDWLWSDIRRLLGIEGAVSELPPARPATEKKVDEPDRTPPTAVTDPLRAGDGRDDASIPHSRPDPLLDPGPCLDSVPLSPELVDTVEGFGWRLTGERLRQRWLRLATMHSSYHYESPCVDVVDADVLTLLSAIGGRWVDVAVIDLYCADSTPRNIGEQSTQFNRLARAVRDGISAHPSIAGSVLLGRGEAAHGAGRDTRVVDRVAAQIIGAMALLGGITAVYRLVDQVYQDIDTAHVSTRHDWRQLLDQEIGRGGTVWEEGRSGPDHHALFTATVRDTKGRSARGEGRSRKAAYADAAESFVRTHLPWVCQRLHAGSVPQRRGPHHTPKGYSGLPADHQRAVRRFTGLFDLQEDAAPLVTQALTHSSWVYENSRETARTGQSDNRLLAQHGSVVGNMLMMHEKAAHLLGRTLLPDPGETAAFTTQEDVWRDLYTELALGAGMLLGRGERDKAGSVAANAVQALLAVAWRIHGFELAERPPRILSRWLRGHQPHEDASTRLIAVCSFFKITIEEAFRWVGTDHERAYAADLTLISDEARVEVRGEYVHGGKSVAKIRTSQCVLDTIMRIARAQEWKLADSERRIAEVVLDAQTTNAAAVRKQGLRRYAQQGHLGVAHLLSDDLDAFAAWAEQAEGLIGELSADTLSGVADYYRRCLSLSKKCPAPVRAAVDDVARWAEEWGGRAEQALSRSPQWWVLDALVTIFGVVRGPLPEAGRPLHVDWSTRDGDNRTIELAVSGVDARGGLPPRVAGALAEFLRTIITFANRYTAALDIEHEWADNELFMIIEVSGTDPEHLVSPFGELVTAQFPAIRWKVDGSDIVLGVSGETGTHTLLQAAAKAVEMPRLPGKKLHDDLSTLQRELAELDQAKSHGDSAEAISGRAEAIRTSATDLRAALHRN